MADTSITAIRCKHIDTYKGPFRSSVKMNMVIDFTLQKRQKFIRNMNELLGNSEKCQCHLCSPDTSY